MECFRCSDALARNLAKQFGTPLYVMDDASIRQRIRQYFELGRRVNTDFHLSYASKANTALGIIKVALEEGCTVDGSSEGELRGALLAGAHPSQLHFHGNVKTPNELNWGLEQGVGQIIIDSFEELEWLAQAPSSHATEFLIRLSVNVEAGIEHKVTTSGSSTKFGFSVESGAASLALSRAKQTSLPISGVHFHLGSMVLNSTAQAMASEVVCQFAKDHGLSSVNLGGGYGAKMSAAVNLEPIESYLQAVLRPTQGLKVTMEPGRSLVAEAGVTLYRVYVRKEAGGTTFLTVDGGLSDNPTPVMYGRPFTVEALGARGDFEPFTISGSHCETDTLFESVLLPKSVGPGDLVQVLCTGAYNASMASNYNRFRRPPMVLLREGKPLLIQRRETWDELFEREIQ